MSNDLNNRAPYKDFETWWDVYPVKTGYITRSPALMALIEEAWTLGADWWIISVDMWIAAGKADPVPDTWDKAQQVMADSGSFDVASWNDAPVLMLRDLLRWQDDDTAELLVDTITAALYAGAAYGWKEALAYQKY